MRRAGTKTLWASLLVGGGLIFLLYRLYLPERTPVPSAPLLVYCAAGLKDPVETTARRYEAEFGIKIQLQYGGSGTLLSNIELSRKGDVYIAADESYLLQARDRNLVAEILPLAEMDPVLAVRKGNPLRILGLSDLARPDVRTAMGNPDTAAIGQSSRRLLSRAGWWTRVEERVRASGVFKPTVNDLANDVKIGAADAAIVWDAIAHQYPELDHLAIPGAEEGRERVAAGILRDSTQPWAALAFARYLTARDRGLEIFQARGYRVIEGDRWAERPELVLFSGGLNRPAIQQTLRDFEEREGVTILTTYNGCGILVGEMRAGKRPDAYFACDTSYVQDVKDLFLPGEDLSSSRLVILTRKDNPHGIRTLADLAKPGVKVAVANEKYSALGGLTLRLLRDNGLLEAVRDRITYGDAPTADYLTIRVRTGREDAAVVYEANTRALGPEFTVHPVELPGAEAVQPMAIGKASDHQHLARRLVEALKSAPSQDRFSRAGFEWRGTPTNTQGRP